MVEFQIPMTVTHHALEICGHAIVGNFEVLVASDAIKLIGWLNSLVEKPMYIHFRVKQLGRFMVMKNLR